MIGLLHDAAIPGLQLSRQSTIFPELDTACGIPHGQDRQDGARRHHDRAAGEAHRTDGIDDDGIDRWVQDWPTGGHGIARGARG